MADVELVIKIPKEEYDLIVNDEACGSNVLTRAIANGTPLPKEHGRLIDVGQCDRKLFYQQCGDENSLITVKTAFDMLLSLPTIIEAEQQRKEQILNGFADMMKGLWNNQDLKMPNDVSERPPVDVVERSKIDKAIEEMDKLASHKVMPISFDQAVAVDVCIRILKKYIGE